jgi:hypothetical protein
VERRIELDAMRLSKFYADIRPFIFIYQFLVQLPKRVAWKKI